MVVHKITNGYVIQTYDTDTKKCVSQEFVAGEVEWEDHWGNLIDPLENEEYQPLNMVQPEKEATDEELEDWAEGELGA